MADSTINDFIQSLPRRYAERFDEAAIGVHKAAADKQHERSVVVRMFATEDELTGVCVVALDEPGLLARLTDALVFCQLDIVNAEAFTRQRSVGNQALDIFWLRRADGTRCTEGDLQELHRQLNERAWGQGASAAPLDASGSSDTRVRFIENETGALDTLEIETEDRAGLLLTLSRTLYAQKVQIVYSEIRTVNGRCLDRFQIAELDGTPVSPGRRLEIQVAVLGATEPAQRLSSLPPRE